MAGGAVRARLIGLRRTLVSRGERWSTEDLHRRSESLEPGPDQLGFFGLLSAEC